MKSESSDLPLLSSKLEFGFGGIQNQTRSCTSPVPANCGADCSGLAAQQVGCNVQVCPSHTKNDFFVENNKILKPDELWGNASPGLFFQHDGNLVFLSGVTPFWDTKTFDKGALKLKVSETSPF